MPTPNDLPMMQLRNESWVASAPPPDLRRALTILIQRRDDESLGTITNPVCADRVETMTKTIKHELESTLAQMNAERLSEQQRFLRMGRDGKSAWFAYLSEWQSRKAAINQQRSFAERILVQCRMNTAASKIVASDRLRAEKTALKSPCAAIANHERAIKDPRQTDLALWAALDTIEIPHGESGYITPRELLRKIGATA